MKIVVVEDEKIIRQGIIELVTEFIEGAVIVGEAENGEKGLAVIQREKPDLVITDIRMPQMDGLDMIKHFYEAGIRCKSLILSAYSEFDYAKKAIAMGVSDYLLKPIEPNEFLRVVKRIKGDLLDEERQNLNNPKQLGSLSNILYGLTEGTVLLDEELGYFLQRQYNIQKDTSFGVLTLYIGDISSEKYFMTENIAETAIKERRTVRYCSFRRNEKKQLTIVVYSNRELKSTERFLQHTLLPRLSGVHGMAVASGYIIGRGIENIKANIEILDQYLDWNIIFGDEVIVSYPKILDIQAQNMPYPMELENKIRSELCRNDLKQVKHTFRSFLEEKTKGIYYPDSVKKNYVRFLWAVIHTIREINYSLYRDLDSEEILSKIMGAVSDKELTDALQLFLSSILVPENERKESLFVKKIQNLVEEYYQEGINLEQTADILGVTPEYISLQLNKEVGMNFSTYIKNYRIQHAKKLLIGTELKQYEIAKAVGYGDPKYFGRVFKETTEMTPAEYRKKHK